MALVLQLVDIGEPAVERVAVAVERLLPGAAPVRPVAALRRGRSHVSWVLDSGLGRVVGKVLLNDHSTVMLNRLAEHRRVWEHGVPVPRLLGFMPSSDAVGGRLLIVSEYLAGCDAEEASRALPATAMSEVMHSAGAALARLHQVPAVAFGDPVSELGLGTGTWSAAVASRVELLTRAYRDHNGESEGVAAGLVSAGLALLGQLADEVSGVVRPAVAHLDVYLPNILVDPAGYFSVLLDLEHVRWVDPVMDFVKPTMWMFEGRSGWAEAFGDGYRETGGWPQRWSERMAVATGWELLTGVDYWTRVKDQPMREDYLRRLRAWVRSDGVGHGWPSMAK